MNDLSPARHSNVPARAVRRRRSPRPRLSCPDASAASCASPVAAPALPHTTHAPCGCKRRGCHRPSLVQQVMISYGWNECPPAGVSKVVGHGELSSSLDTRDVLRGGAEEPAVNTGNPALSYMRKNGERRARARGFESETWVYEWLHSAGISGPLILTCKKESHHVQTPPPPHTSTSPGTHTSPQ